MPPFFSNYPAYYLYVPEWGRNYQKIADFIQKANVKRSVRTFTTPIASVAALNTLVQGVIDANSFECVDHVVPVVGSASPLTDARGNVIGMMVVLFSINNALYLEFHGKPLY